MLEVSEGGRESRPLLRFIWSWTKTAATFVVKGTVVGGGVGDRAVDPKGGPPSGSDNGLGGGKGPVRPRSSSLSSSSLRPSSASSPLASSSAPASGRTTSAAGTTKLGAAATPAASKLHPTVRGSSLKPRQLLSDPATPSAAPPSTPPSQSSKQKGGSPQTPGSSNDCPRAPRRALVWSAYPFDIRNGVTPPKRNWFSSEIVSRRAAHHSRAPSRRMRALVQ
jgi:hypothetical protein